LIVFPAPSTVTPSGMGGSGAVVSQVAFNVHNVGVIVNVQAGSTTAFAVLIETAVVSTR